MSQSWIDDQGMVGVIDLHQPLLKQHSLRDRNLGIVLSLQDQDAGRNIADDLGGIVQGEVGLQPYTSWQRLIGEQNLRLLDYQWFQVILNADVARLVEGYD